MNEIQKISDIELIEVLRNSLYPGVNDDSIKMVIGYCNAAGLDVMQKPVHIVPMWDSKARANRDVIMPGINLYRVNAARSGQLAGISEPEFGPEVDDNLDGVAITYPQWCRVTVKRALNNGHVAEFTAVERWRENYATKGRDTAAPNAMWAKRPYAQLAKCAQAQALRMAFPESCGQPTAEEMAGKDLHAEGVIFDAETGEVIKDRRSPEQLPDYPDDKFQASLGKWRDLIQSGKKTPGQIIATVCSSYRMSAEQAQIVNKLAAPAEPDFERPKDDWVSEFDEGQGE